MKTRSRLLIATLSLGMLYALGCGDTETKEVTVVTPYVTISGDVALAVGQTLTLAATTKEGTDASYVWSSSNEAVATVDASGVVSGLAAGQTVISAKGSDSGKEGKWGVYVYVQQEQSADEMKKYKDAWAASAHADAASESFRHWDADGAVPVSCAKCHSGLGFLDFLGEDGTAPGVVDNAALTTSVISCAACHNDSASALSAVTFPSGVELTGLGPESRCMTCHQGRESTVSVDDAITTAAPADDDTVSASLKFKNIHYFATAATMYGALVKGGYQYASKSYEGKFAHVEGIDTCTSCHNPHSLTVKVNSCKACHEGVEKAADFRNVRMPGSKVDYDGDGDVAEGLYHEIEGLRLKLMSALLKYAKTIAGQPLVYSETAYPYFINDANENGAADEGETGYSAWTARLLRAAFNYQFAAKDVGAYAHNGKYVVQLLYDSIEDLNAKLAVADRIDLDAAHRNDAGHFDSTAEAWRHWDADGMVPGDCARCHSAAGLPFYLTFKQDIMQPISDSMSCATCHDNPTDFSSQYAAGAVTFPSGVALDSGSSTMNLCLNCHRGRNSGPTVDGVLAGKDLDTTDSSLRFQNIHYFPAGATLYGDEAKGAYQYAGKTYAGRFEHVASFATCNSCHGVHSLQVKQASCSGCHAGIVSLTEIRMGGDDYDGDGSKTEGIYAEIQGMMELLYTEIKAYAKTAGTPIVYSAAAYPYFFIDANDNGQIDDGEGGYKPWTPRLLKAAYNYQYAQKDPGAFAHNAEYLLQVLYDSIEDLGGDVSGLKRP